MVLCRGKMAMLLVVLAVWCPLFVEAQEPVETKKNLRLKRLELSNRGESDVSIQRAELEAIRRLDDVGDSNNRAISVHSCNAYDSEYVTQARANPNTSDQCLEGGDNCASGCCRVFRWLECDERNSYTHLACVCDKDESAPPPPPPPPPPSPPSAPVGPPVFQPDPATCVDYLSANAVASRNHPSTSLECKEGNTCDGCCRLVTWLQCDTQNSLSAFPCVCAAPSDRVETDPPQIAPVGAPVETSVDPPVNPPVDPPVNPPVDPPVNPPVPPQAPTCANWNADEVVAARAHPETDDECRVGGSCNGCCRRYIWLVCDEDDALDYLDCVCPEGSNPPPPPPPPPPSAPVPRPTLQPLRVIPPSFFTSTQPPEGADGGVDDGGGNNGDTNDSGVEACVAWDSELAVAARLHPETETECEAGGSCDGCCRLYNWLVCDNDNSLAYLDCVCPQNGLPAPPPPPRGPGTATPAGGKNKTSKSQKEKQPNPAGPPPPPPRGPSSPTLPPDSTRVAVEESRQCVAFDDMKNHANHSLSDDACLENTCGQGCCRAYWWLICDTDDTFPDLQCVCNSNTKTSSEWEQLAMESPPSPTPPPQTLPPALKAIAMNAGDIDADSCIGGSFFHEQEAYTEIAQPCESASDCSGDTCCIATFCLCGPTNMFQDACVPSE